MQKAADLESLATGPEAYVRPAMRCKGRILMTALLAYGKTLAQKVRPGSIPNYLVDISRAARAGP